MSQKKRNTNFLPKIDVNKCISVPNTATETKQFVLKQPFLSRDLPEGAMDKIHRHVRDDFQVGDDISGILKYLKSEENDEKRFISIQIYTFVIFASGFGVFMNKCTKLMKAQH